MKALMMLTLLIMLVTFSEASLSSGNEDLFVHPSPTQPRNTHQMPDAVKRQSIPTTLPANWFSIGCFVDNVNSRTLSGATYIDQINMTIENCITFCSGTSTGAFGIPPQPFIFKFAGTEFSSECYCDNAIENSAPSAPSTDCNFGCTGNRNELCGGPDRLNVFLFGGNLPPPPPPPPSVRSPIGQWTSMGCFSDSVTARTLRTAVGVNGPMTEEACVAQCQSEKFGLSGVEFSSECFCDTVISNGGLPIPASSCNMACQGDSSELCGGPNALNVYNFTGTAT